MLKKIMIFLFIMFCLSFALLGKNEVNANNYFYTKYNVISTPQTSYVLGSHPTYGNERQHWFDYTSVESYSTVNVNSSTGEITYAGADILPLSSSSGRYVRQSSTRVLRLRSHQGVDAETKQYIMYVDNLGVVQQTTYSYARGSLVESNILAANGTYPVNGRHSDGFWYVRGSIANSAPTTPTLTIPTVDFETGSQQIISWNSTDADGDALTYTLEASYNNGSSWASLYSGTNKTYTYTTPTSQTQVNFRVRAYDGTSYSAYSTSVNKTIRKTMYSWSKYNVSLTYGSWSAESTSMASYKYRYASNINFYSNVTWDGNNYVGSFPLQNVFTEPIQMINLNVNIFNGTTTTSWMRLSSFVSETWEGGNVPYFNFSAIQYTRTRNSSYTRGSLIESGIIAEDGTYPTNGRHTDGYWYVRGSMASATPNAPTLTVPTVQFEHGDVHLITWNSSNTDAVTYTLEASYNNGSSWVSLYSGANKNYTYTVPSNQTQVMFRVKASNGSNDSTYDTSVNKTIREVMYYWSKYTIINKGDGWTSFYWAKGSFIETIQGGFNAYLHDQRNLDGFWWVRGQRVLAGDITPPIIELTEQTDYASTSTVTVTTFDVSAVTVTKWAVGNHPVSYFTTSGTNVTGGQFTTTQNGIYTVYARDANGNATVQTIEVSKVDGANPSGILTQNPTEFTNENVTFTAIGEDAGSGMKRIKLPNGTYVNDSIATYTVSANGVYTFEFEDYAGNVLLTSITVNNIDKTAPTIRFTPNSREADFKDIEVQTAITDSGGSGFKEFRYAWTKDETRPTEGWGEWSAAPNPLIVQEKGGKWTLHMEATDVAGNVGYAVSGLYEKIVVSGGPSVTINVFPTPTGVWQNKPIDVYVMDSGDAELLAKAKKYYSVTNSPLYPSSFGTLVPIDKKIQLNLQGENFVHIQYALDDGTKIAATAGPYLIDTSSIADFEMELVNTAGVEVTDWTNESLRLMIGNPTTSSISGFKKQYRIDGVHTDWQNYVDGTTINVEGNYRIFGRMVSGTGEASAQKTVNAKIDQTKPTVTLLRLVKNTDNTYDIHLKTEDTFSGVKEVSLNNGTKLTKMNMNNQFEINGLTTKPTYLTITDAAGNALTPVSFAAEPVLTFDAPYKTDTPLYREDVQVNLSGATGYLIGNRGYNCLTNPCQVTLSHNTTLTAVRTEGEKETRTAIAIQNIDQSTLQLVLSGKRNNPRPNELTFSWNYTLTSGTLTCTEDGQTKTYGISGKSFSLNGKNYAYQCTVSGIYKGITLTSNVWIIHPSGNAPLDGTGDLSGQTKTTNVHLLETRLGKGYLINGKSDNYKHMILPIPQNEITAN